MEKRLALVLLGKYIQVDFPCIRNLKLFKQIVDSLAFDKTTGGKVALKVESLKSQHSQLGWEYKMYQDLQGGGDSWFSLFPYLCVYIVLSSLVLTEGIPKVYWLGKEGRYQVLGIDLLIFLCVTCLLLTLELLQ